MKTLLLLLIVFLFVSPAFAQEPVRESVIYTLATNDNALRFAVVNSLDSPRAVYQTGEIIVTQYVEPTLLILPDLPFSHAEQLLLYAHLMMWKHLGQLMMQDAQGLPYETHLRWADFWYSFYQPSMEYCADTYGYDLDNVWDTERFGNDPRHNKQQEKRTESTR